MTAGPRFSASSVQAAAFSRFSALRTIPLRPLVSWGSAESRLNGLLQLTKGLSGIVRKAEKREKAAA